MLEPIRLEPRLTYDRAITHVSDKNVATYSYWLLVECAAEQCEVDVPDAMDWVDFNIVGLQAGSDDRFKIDYGVRDEHE
jgi:hypothetical protein